MSVTTMAEYYAAQHRTFANNVKAFKHFGGLKLHANGSVACTTHLK